MESRKRFLLNRKGQLKQTGNPLTCQLSRMNKSGQVTIFVIIAIVIVIGIVLFFVLKGGIDRGGISQELMPVYGYYDSCIQTELEKALSIAGSQGGRIDIGNYESGSEFAPFSNQLNFLGVPVGYWYYVSGNGVVKENVPDIDEIEKDLENYLLEKIGECDFSVLEEEGFVVDLGDIKEVDVRIDNVQVRVRVESDLIVSKGEESAVRREQEIVINSKFREYYDLAVDIYNKEKKDGFLEDYGVDVLRNYAPVDGTEIQCSPKIWKTREIVDELKNGLEDNIRKIKLDGSYYDLNRKEDRYFVVNLEEKVNENVQFVYSKNWPTKIEIQGDGVEQELIIAEAVGNQEGLGILGFCYVPYHYIYDISFPVLIQVFDNENIFQFPVAVIIDNNVAREIEFNEDYLVFEEEFDLCEFKEQEIEANVFDVNLNRVDGVVSYECFTQRCNLGETENGVLRASVPQCVNGFLNVRAEGFAEKKQIFSSNSETSADIVLDREHEVDVELNLGGLAVSENALITFTKDSKSVTALLPELRSVKLSEGEYEIRVYVYDDSNIVLPGSTKTQCTKVPESGLFGIFGATREECFDISIPETRIENALIGGGTGNDFFLESELIKGKVIIDATALPRPSNLQELQNNFAAFEAGKVNVRFENV